MFNGTQGVYTSDKPELQSYFDYTRLSTVDYRHVGGQWVLKVTGINGVPAGAPASAATVRKERAREKYTGVGKGGGGRNEETWE